MKLTKIATEKPEVKLEVGDFFVAETPAFGFRDIRVIIKWENGKFGILRLSDGQTFGTYSSIGDIQREYKGVRKVKLEEIKYTEL